MSDPVTPSVDKTRSAPNADTFKKVSSGDKSAESATAGAPMKMGGDEIKLSEATTAALESAEFDSEKVNQIKVLQKNIFLFL